MYNIVEVGKENIILVSSNDLEFIKNYLKDIIETNKFLAKYYNWSRIPEFKIVEVK